MSFLSVLKDVLSQGTPPTGTTTTSTTTPMVVPNLNVSKFFTTMPNRDNGRQNRKNKNRDRNPAELPDTNGPMRQVLNQYVQSQGGPTAYLQAQNPDSLELVRRLLANETVPGQITQQKIGKLARQTAKPQINAMLDYMKSQSKDTEAPVNRRVGLQSLLETLGQSRSLNQALNINTAEQPAPVQDILSEAYSRGQDSAARNLANKQQAQYEADVKATLEQVVLPRVQLYSALQNDMVNQWQQAQYDRASRIQDPDRQAFALSAIDNLAMLKRMKVDQWANDMVNPYTQGQKGTFGDIMSKYVGAEQAMQNRFDAPITSISAGNRNLTAPQTSAPGSSLQQLFGPTAVPGGTQLARAANSNPYGTAQQQAGTPYSPDQFTYDASSGTANDAYSQALAQLAVNGFDTTELLNSDPYSQ